MLINLEAFEEVDKRKYILPIKGIFAAISLRNILKHLILVIFIIKTYKIFVYYRQQIQ